MKKWGESGGERGGDQGGNERREERQYKILGFLSASYKCYLLFVACGLANTELFSAHFSLFWINQCYLFHFISLLFLLKKKSMMFHRKI